MAVAAKVCRTRLKIEGQLEDRPRMIKAYVKTKRGEFAMVLRPFEQRGLLVWLASCGCHRIFLGQTGNN